MKTERLASHNEAREALVLSVAGVTAIADRVFAFDDLVLSVFADRAKERGSRGFPRAS
jgi:hypothetical protein